ncbi:MAG TPA: MBL fold metallo-hydrolase [Geminicoccus sp.]|uniref:MBL fold metallo-hydrolase n=1 Tax=Geminicoccus sp. TaxID=2024832 RepID=UPI002E2EDCF4|nr:MBL fold metallo-hydrolase [Geminicoccus sp.]HEX2529277.1 MBL fold metallo-hydrolase [Geminicoccus sp.]
MTTHLKTMTIKTRRDVLSVLAGAPVLLAGCAGPTEPRHIPSMPWHHVEGGFRNPPGSPERAGDRGEWWAFMWRGLSRRDVVDLPGGHVVPTSTAKATLTAARDGDLVTWLGHAGFLMRLNGLWIATDPFLSEYASPVPPFGPKRFAPVSLAVEDLPPLDVLILSHNHYDHLDRPTLERLPLGPNAVLICPLKVAGYVDTSRFARVVELDWHGQTELAGLGITSIPSIHFSARTLWDRNESLWGGFILTTPSKRIYFAGDTTFGPVFGEIGPLYGPVDLALLPIGAYEPRKLMQASHCTPEEAVQIGQLFQARQAIGMHWGVVRLTDEPPFEPPMRFRDAIATAGLGDAWGGIMAVGETRPIG